VWWSKARGTKKGGISNSGLFFTTEETERTEKNQGKREKSTFFLKRNSVCSVVNFFRLKPEAAYKKGKLYPGRAAEPQNIGGLAATDGYMPFTVCVSSRWAGIQLIYSI
jgi:hypothetical protein